MQHSIGAEMARSFNDILALVAPLAAARRIHARHVYEQVRSYDAAAKGRIGDRWRRPKTSAIAETRGALTELRAASRDLVRNNGYAATAKRKTVAHIVGKGLTPRFKGLTAPQKTELGAIWDEWVDEADLEGDLDLYSLQKLAIECWWESGEAILRFVPMPSSARMKIPLKVQVLEPDFIDDQLTRQEPGGNTTVQGVEYSPMGEVVAYWMFREHPGNDSFIRFRGTAERVPAKYVARIFERLRPGQVRGVPLLAPVTLALRDLGEYQEAERVRKKIEACLAAFVTTDDSETGPLTGESQTDDTGKKISTFRPGMIERLNPGEEVTFVAPAVGGDPTGYLRQQLYEISAGVGIPYHALTGDLSNANYSSLREGKLDFWNLIDIWQSHMAFPAMRRVFAQFSDLATTLHGAPALPGRVEWNIPRRQWVDPEKDLKAEKAEIRAGLKSWQSAVAERGGDVDEVIAQFEEAFTKFDELGFTFDIDARQVNFTGAKHGSGATEPRNSQEADDGEDEDEDAGDG